VAARRLRARTIRIDGVEDTPKTIVVDTLIQDLLADCARHRVTNSTLIASLASAEYIHGGAPKKPKISQLLNHVNLSMDSIVRITWAKGARTKLVHCCCKNLITLCKNSNMPIGLCEV